MLSHVAHLYKDERVLAGAVARFAASGLRANDAVVLVIRPEHWELARPTVSASIHDLDARIRVGLLTVADCGRTLEGLLVGGEPDRDRFQDAVGGLLDAAARASKRTRVFGEMVDVLAERGRPDAAQRLESYWNDLRRTRRFSLLCGYRLDPFEAGPMLNDICRSHDGVHAEDQDGRLGRSLELAVDKELGAMQAAMLRTVVGQGHAPSWRDTLLWLGAQMPVTSGRVLSRAREIYESAT